MAAANSRSSAGASVADQEFVEVTVEVAGVDAAFDHHRVADQALEEVDIGFGPDDVAGGQRFAQALEGAVRAVASWTMSLAIIGS